MVKYSGKLLREKTLLASEFPSDGAGGRIQSLSMSMEHFPEGMGRVFFFSPRMSMVK